MRPLIYGIALLLLAACSSTDSFTPRVTGLAAANGTNDPTPLALPLRICNVPKSFSTDVVRGFGPDPVVFDILGNDFLPEVSQATSSNGDHYVRPLVALEGPATYTDPGAGVLDSGRIVFRLEYRDVPLVEGLYAVTVRNPDPSEPVTARLENAVQIVGGPHAVPADAHVCPFFGSSILAFRGGPFVPGLRVRSSLLSNSDLKLTIDAPDQVSVEIPQASGVGQTLDLTFLDPAGCFWNVSLPVSCP